MGSLVPVSLLVLCLCAKSLQNNKMRRKGHTNGFVDPGMDFGGAGFAGGSTNSMAGNMVVDSGFRGGILGMNQRFGQSGLNDGVNAGINTGVDARFNTVGNAGFNTGQNDRFNTAIGGYQVDPGFGENIGTVDPGFNNGFGGVDPGFGLDSVGSVDPGFGVDPGSKFVGRGQDFGKSGTGGMNRLVGDNPGFIDAGPEFLGSRNAGRTGNNFVDFGASGGDFVGGQMKRRFVEPVMGATAGDTFFPEQGDIAVQSVPTSRAVNIGQSVGGFNGKKLQGFSTNDPYTEAGVSGPVATPSTERFMGSYPEFNKHQSNDPNTEAGIGGPIAVPSTERYMGSYPGFTKHHSKLTTIVRPVVRPIIRPIVRPVIRRVVRPIINRQVVRRVVRPIVRPVINRIVRPIIRRPVINRIVRPIIRRIVRPVERAADPNFGTGGVGGINRNSQIGGGKAYPTVDPDFGVGGVGGIDRYPSAQRGKMYKGRPIKYY